MANTKGQTLETLALRNHIAEILDWCEGDEEAAGELELEGEEGIIIPQQTANTRVQHVKATLAKFAATFPHETKVENAVD